jgi:lipid-A-disaccharide synthase
MSQTQILISAGEASGDLYASRLAAELMRRTGAHFFGMGGEHMRAAGVELVANSADVTVSGFNEVWGKMAVLHRVLWRLKREARERKPKLAVLTDFPSFHIRLARRMNWQHIPCVCFVAPQFWAWRPWRVKLLRERYARALCIFPFELDFYRKAGVETSFIGHPLVDIVRPSLPRAEFFSRFGLDASQLLVALLPGSRMSEIRHNLPVMLEASQQIAQRHERTQFALALAAGFTARIISPAESSEGTLIIQSGETDQGFRLPGGVDLHVVPGMTYDVVASASAAIVASGTATVETALLGTPMVVVYKVARFTELLLRALVKTPYFAMPNLIAGRRVVPELFQQDCAAPRISEEVLRIMDSPEARQEMLQGLAEVRGKLGPGGAIERAADIIAGMLESI